MAEATIEQPFLAKMDGNLSGRNDKTTILRARPSLLVSSLISHLQRLPLSFSSNYPRPSTSCPLGSRAVRAKFRSSINSWT